MLFPCLGCLTPDKHGSAHSPALLTTLTSLLPREVFSITLGALEMQGPGLGDAQTQPPTPCTVAGTQKAPNKHLMKKITLLHH